MPFCLFRYRSLAERARSRAQVAEKLFSPSFMSCVFLSDEEACQEAAAAAAAGTTAADSGTERALLTRHRYQLNQESGSIYFYTVYFCR